MYTLLFPFFVPSFVFVFVRWSFVCPLDYSATSSPPDDPDLDPDPVIPIPTRQTHSTFETSPIIYHASHATSLLHHPHSPSTPPSLPPYLYLLPSSSCPYQFFVFCVSYLFFWIVSLRLSRFQVFFLCSIYNFDVVWVPSLDVLFTSPIPFL
ncbi:hypothetical protein FRB91_009012 [Serendipita sp. 411]|nr:hypothetical protein FRC18_000613 [Serendipita sp. 400]KAG8850496.1 hypothetical protein FRB91_009012 [Serendipita sp. 411]